jgi:hypothetical protein
MGRGSHLYYLAPVLLPPQHRLNIELRRREEGGGGEWAPGAGDDGGRSAGGGNEEGARENRRMGESVRARGREGGGWVVGAQTDAREDDRIGLKFRVRKSYL